MSAQQDPNHDLIHPVPTGAAQSGQTGQCHQYPAITLDGNSSAQFGDVYHQYYATAPVRSSMIIPFKRDQHFVPRDVLGEVCQRAQEPAARVGLVGLGGVGKTQIAIEYAYQRREVDPQMWIFWVHASSSARFEESYQQIARQVRIAGWSDQKANVLDLVHVWLSDENNGRWAMVVDNADSEDVMFGPRGGTAGSTSTRPLCEYLPTSTRGSIVITSRSRIVVEGLIENVEDISDVKPMVEQEAIALLNKRLKTSQRDTDQIQMVRLVRELDFMPLAVAQAAAYINQMGPRMTVPKYIDRLMQNEFEREALLQKDIRDPRRDGRASNSIIVTWHTSFEQIQKTRSSAARLLALMSLFDRESIPELLLKGQYLIEDVAQSDRNGERDAVHDDHVFDEDIATLSMYNLVRTSVDDHQLYMHRLVQFSTRKWLELHGDLGYWQDRYISLLDAALPAAEYKNWSLYRSLFPHVEVMMMWEMASDDSLQIYARVLYRAAWYAMEQGHCMIAEQMARLSLESRQRLFGPNHIETLGSMKRQAHVLQYQGKYEEAEELLRRLLAIVREELGVSDSSTLSVAHILADTMCQQGKYEEAEHMHRDILRIREVSNGSSHRETLTSMNNLAFTLQMQDKLDQAEPLYRKALDGRQKVFGPHHAGTLRTMGNLANVLLYQGLYDEAEQMHRHVLTEQEKSLGPNHPNTLTGLQALAATLSYQKKYVQALQLYDRAMEGFFQVLGPTHPRSLECQEHRQSVQEDWNQLRHC